MASLTTQLVLCLSFTIVHPLTTSLNKDLWVNTHGLPLPEAPRPGIAYKDWSSWSGPISTSSSCFFYIFKHCELMPPSRRVLSLILSRIALMLPISRNISTSAIFCGGTLRSQPPQALHPLPLPPLFLVRKRLPPLLSASDLPHPPSPL